MLQGPYHPNIYDTSTIAPSYWEATAPLCASTHAPIDGDHVCEVAIIGGGFTGLSSALHLARDHGIEARVLEAGPIGWGASGRNGGFCGLGSTKLSFEAMIKSYGLEETKRFYNCQLEGIELVQNLAESESIDFDAAGGGNYGVAHAPGALKGIEQYAKDLQQHFGIKTRILSRDEFAAEVHDGQEQFGGIHIEAGFALHPLRFCRGLADAAARHGAIVHPNSKVISWRREDDGTHILTTPSGSLKARRVVIAANGYLPEKLSPDFKGRIMPVISNIVVTRPLREDELAAQSWRSHSPIYNARNLLFYYRLLPDNRLLLGARGDTKGNAEGASKTKAWMERRIGEIFPGFERPETAYFWRGLVCMTRKSAPSLGFLESDPSVFYSYGYHASGVPLRPGQAGFWLD